MEKYFDVLHAEKERDPKTGKLSGFLVPERKEFKSNSVLIVDDICDGGGTFLGLAPELYDLDLYLYVTHGIFSKGLTDLSKSFKHIYTTDSFNHGLNHESLTIIPCDGFIKSKIFTSEEVWNSSVSNR